MTCKSENISWSHCRRLATSYTLNIRKNQKFCNSVWRNKRTMSREILNKLLHLKTFINKKLPEAAITISTPILMSDKGKAVMTSWQLTYHPISLKIDILINRNITGKYLSCSEFHLNESGINFLTKSLVSNLQKL